MTLSPSKATQLTASPSYTSHSNCCSIGEITEEPVVSCGYCRLEVYCDRDCKKVRFNAVGNFSKHLLYFVASRFHLLRHRSIGSVVGTRRLAKTALKGAPSKHIGSGSPVE